MTRMRAIAPASLFAALAIAPNPEGGAAPLGAQGTWTRFNTSVSAGNSPNRGTAER